MLDVLWGARVLSTLAVVSAAGSLLAGCGGSLKDTCENIDWRGHQCQALRNVEWAKEHGVSPQVIEGYESLPEDAR